MQGHRYVAPKKATKLKAEKLKKSFEKGIRQRIEEDLTQRAYKKGESNFTVVQGSSSSSKSKADKNKRKK